MPNSSITCISRSTTASLALERALCDRAGLEDVVAGQGVGDVAGQRELLDALRERRVRRRLDGAGVGLAVAPSAAAGDGRVTSVGASANRSMP